ncbi:very short patch repair endonuclease [Leisingera sp. M523]|uniref:very short patch repair endonuclease n=1 Tax=Leisingera sp. M523 TaxID=2867013 RepID=UPI0021A428DC|nr:DNA mismatch endonuclease Vsr [Leisingera sp. M523]UWQ27524.1 DNA mismatch endonuclease Vsr [Leisingera sp. M523]
MADTLTPERRSANMAKIRAKHTKPEMLVRRMVHGLGFRYRLHRKDLPGKPDLVFGPRRKVIFVHGCFWHLHECRDGRIPASRRDYWEPKLLRNTLRDAEQLAALQAAGWQVLTVWECETKDQDALRIRLRAFLENEE